MLNKFFSPKIRKATWCCQHSTSSYRKNAATTETIPPNEIFQTAFTQFFDVWRLEK